MILPTCREVAFGEIEGAPWYKRIFFTPHFWMCSRCRSYRRGMDLINAALRRRWGQSQYTIRPAALRRMIERFRSRAL